MFSAQKNAAPANGKLFVEDVFSTYLYDGNSTARNIVNGVDLSSKGGMVWIKTRTQGSAGWDHVINDTVRGPNRSLFSNTTGAEVTSLSNMVTGFNADGFSLGVDANSYLVNQTGYGGYASWTFREAPKFFDVVTFTGTGSGQIVNHNLGVTPGFVLIKTTGVSGDWWAVHRSANGFMRLQLTNAATSTGVAGIGPIGSTAMLQADATSFKPESFIGTGQTAVAYLFAHDATADGIIQCGSYTGNGSSTGPIVTLGWEPQWVMIKNTSTNGTDWIMLDNMRGMPVGFVDARLTANTSDAESSGGDFLSPTATGFQLTTTSSAVNTNGSTYIYIAIRRPMKTPTLGTSVFSSIIQSSGTNPRDIDVGINPDLMIAAARTGGSNTASDRLRGDALLEVNSTSAGATGTTQTIVGRANNSIRISSANITGFATTDSVFWNFRRAPSFMDVVCYTGTGAGVQTLNHNLGVTPELIILKRRQSTSAIGWPVASNITPTNFVLQWLNLTDGGSSASYSTSTVFSAQPTASQFSVGSNTDAGASGPGYIAYLFASCPGVSKVGSYTGNGSSQTINCGFAAGARFVIIKRTDSTGDWYVWDTARGIVAGNDPHRSLNTTAAEVTTDDTIDTDSSGFVVNQVAATNVNVNAATYIYLAIA